MAKQPKDTKSKFRQNGVSALGGIWRRHLTKLRLVVIAVSLPAVWQVYQKWLSSALEHSATAIWAEVFDKPMPEGYIIRLDLRFGLDENVEAARYERTRVTLWPARCKWEDGDRLTRTLDHSNSYQHVILEVTCNYNGHIKVMLTPLYGEKATIYDGTPTDRESHPFAGVPGSYRFGQLQITRVYTDTSRVPVNSCQLMNNCDEFDPSFPE